VVEIEGEAILLVVALTKTNSTRKESLNAKDSGRAMSIKLNEVLASTLAEVRAKVSERLGRELEKALEVEID